MNVYLNGEFAFGISRTIAPWLEEGQDLTQERIDELQSQDRIESAYQRSLNYLSYRSRSEQEIRLNLQKADYEPEVIDHILDKLRQAGWVDDQAFAQEWVENRSRFKPRGKRALSSELFQKGIPHPIIETAIQDLDELALADICARQKVARYQDLDQAEFQKKLSSFLARRGFPYDISRQIVSDLWQETQQSLDTDH